MWPERSPKQTTWLQHLPAIRTRASHCSKDGHDTRLHFALPPWQPLQTPATLCSSSTDLTGFPTRSSFQQGACEHLIPAWELTAASAPPPAPWTTVHGSSLQKYSLTWPTPGQLPPLYTEKTRFFFSALTSSGNETLLNVMIHSFQIPH